MSDDEIELLEAKLDDGKDLYWTGDDNKIMKIIKIGNPPIEKDGDEPEPSKCAYNRYGKYVALYNVELGDFFIRERIK